MSINDGGPPGENAPRLTQSVTRSPPRCASAAPNPRHPQVTGGTPWCYSNCVDEQPGTHSPAGTGDGGGRREWAGHRRVRPARPRFGFPARNRRAGTPADRGGRAGGGVRPGGGDPARPGRAPHPAGRRSPGARRRTGRADRPGSARGLSPAGVDAIAFSTTGVSVIAISAIGISASGASPTGNSATGASASGNGASWSGAEGCGRHRGGADRIAGGRADRATPRGHRL